VQGARFRHVHRTAQFILQVGEETAREKWGSGRSRLDKQVEVAVIAGYPRAKEPNTRMLVTLCLAAIARIASRLVARSSSSVMVASVVNPFPALAGTARFAGLAFSNRHWRDLLAGPWFRTLRLCGGGAGRPGTGASALSDVQSRES
jgi:hypothetical protein